MKKKITILIFFCFFISFIDFINPINAEGYFYPYNFNTDKEQYFADDIIETNASWFLSYDQENEISYIQIRIFNSLNSLIWNSPEYHEIGTSENGYTIQHINNVSIKELDLSFNNNTTTIIITLFLYYLSSMPPMVTTEYYLNKTINIQKKELICELGGLREEVTYGEQLNLSVSFFDFDNQTYLSNFSCIVEIINNNSKLFYKEYSANHSTNILFIIPSIYNMSIGMNILNITIIEFDIYDHKSFFFFISVNKVPILTRIIEYKDKFISHENLYLKIYHFYLNNNIEIPLGNHSIFFQFKQSNIILFEKSNYTDINGIAQVKILNNDLGFLKSINEINISIIFEGSQFLLNNTLNLHLNIIRDSSSTELILFISIFIIVAIPIFVIIIKKLVIGKKKTQLEDITITY